MLLVTKISLGEFLNYKEEYNKCLTHNVNNKYISNIFVFINGHNNDFPKHKKINYFFKKEFEQNSIIEFCKKKSTEDKIIFCKNPLIAFNEDLNSLKDEKSLFSNKDFMIFDKETKFDSITSFKKPTIKTTDYNYTSKNDVDTNSFNNIIIRKKGELVKTEKPKLSKKLDIIVVSVNYNDFLITTLKTNLLNFENVTVVTSSEDKLCQEICKKYGVNIVITDVMYENDAKFNKGKAINSAINSLIDPGFILLIDADIIIKNSINTDNLDFDVLYTSDRWMCETYNDLIKIENDPNALSKLYNESDKGIGFFQLFHYSKASSYPESSDNAAFSDLLFRDKFINRQNINNTVIHLGKSYQNWDGRKTERFLTDEQFQEIFISIKKIFDINDYFDKIYCLNLEKRKDRWYDVCKEFKNNSIVVERFEALSGENISDDELYNYNKGHFSDEDASKHGLIENKNSLACLLSHIEIIKQAKVNGYNKILIFEDDVIFSENFAKEIKKIKSLDWNLLYLGASQFDWSDINIENGYYKSKNTLGSFAYSIKSEVFDYIIEIFESQKLSVDNSLGVFQKSSIAKSYTIFPNIVISKVSDSNIRESKDLEEYSKMMKWDLKDFRIQKNNSNFEVVNLSNEKSGKKILFLINLNDVGGAEYVSYQHIKICKKLGYRPVVVSAGKGMFFNKINELNVDLFYSQLNKIDQKEILPVLNQISKDCEIIYNCNYFGITPYIKELKNLRKFKYYTIAHSDIEWVVNTIFEYDNITDKYIVIHDKIRNEFNKKGVCNTRIFTVPNFVDYEDINSKSISLKKEEIKKELEFTQEDFVIGMVTRISPDKNIIDALKVVKKVSEFIPNVKLLIVGEAPNTTEAIPYRNETLEYIKNLGITDKVKITGHIDNNKVFKYIKSFDISINTSPSEGLPISMLEQMACGIHCIFPSHGEIPVVLEGYGSVINIKQKKSFDINDEENYIFNRYSDTELQLFVDEIIRVHKEGPIKPETISEHISWTRNPIRFEYYFDFLYGDYKDGVTFLIRARNEEKNVEECLKTILDAADEIIFVDHLSTDETYNKVFELSKKNDKIKLFKYDREVPKVGLNYQQNIKSTGNSIANYYNFCLSKVTKKTVIKWDADFIAEQKNLLEMIDKFNLRTREDSFSMWFTGKTIFYHNDKKYINNNSYYDEYRAFSIINGLRWDDAERCEYVSRNYANNSIGLRYEKICFYEVKRTDQDEFVSRDVLIDRRDEVDFRIINDLNSGIVPSELKFYREPNTLKFILICATGRSGSTTLQRIINTVPNSNINGENYGSIADLLQSYEHLKMTIQKLPKSEIYEKLTPELCEQENIKPCWYNSFDMNKIKENYKSLIIDLLRGSDDNLVIGFKEITYHNKLHLIDTFKELFPNTKAICHYKEDVHSQTNSSSKNNWWTENDKEFLTEYNQQLIEFANSRDFTHEFTFEKLFDVTEVEKLFNFLEEDLNIEKYQMIINNNLDY